MTAKRRKEVNRLIDSFIQWIGSFSSLLMHTFFFLFCMFAGIICGHWDTVLLVLTTVVSLEAIYLAIFIQMSINRNTESLEAVESDIDEIQEDVEDIAEDVDKIHENVEDIAEDVDELQENVEEIAEDVEELNEEDTKEESQEDHDRRIMKDIQDNLSKIATDLEQLKKKK